MGRLYRMWRRGYSLWLEFSTMNIETYASSTTYFAFLALVPTLTLCISLVSLVGISEQQVVDFFTVLLPGALEELVKALVKDAFNSSGIAFSLSTITLLWSASKGVKALRVGLNVANAVEETRNVFAVAAISIVAVVALGIMVAGMMYIVFSDSLLSIAMKVIPGLRIPDVLLEATNPIVVLVLGTFILDVFYTYLPAGRRSLSGQLPGAVLASIACGVLSFGFRVYVDGFWNYTVLYGSIATVALLLIWMYLLSHILLLGGFLNRMISAGMFRFVKED